MKSFMVTNFAKLQKKQFFCCLWTYQLFVIFIGLLAGNRWGCEIRV